MGLGPDPAGLLFNEPELAISQWLEKVARRQWLGTLDSSVVAQAGLCVKSDANDQCPYSSDSKSRSGCSEKRRPDLSWLLSSANCSQWQASWRPRTLPCVTVADLEPCHNLCCKPEGVKSSLSWHMRCTGLLNLVNKLQPTQKPASAPFLK